MIAVAEDRFESSPIGEQSRIGFHRGHALYHRLSNHGSPIGEALPYRLHTRLVRYERSPRPASRVG